MTATARTTTLGIAVTHASFDEQRRTWLREGILPRIRGPVLVVEDQHRSGVWPVTHRALVSLQLRRDLSHALVLQDDMLPCAGFLAQLTEAISANPDQVLGLFCGRPTLVEAARSRGSSWAVIDGGWAWGGSTVWPSSVLADFLRFEACFRDQLAPSKGDDNRFALYLALTGRAIWVTVPSLLYHLAPTTSLLGHNSTAISGRTASWYVDHPGPIDWQAGLGDPPRVRASLGRGVDRRAYDAIRASWDGPPA